MTNKILAKYLFHEASAREIARVEKWLLQSEANHIELDLLRERIEQATLRYRPDTFVAARALEKIRRTVRKPISLLRKMLRISAAVVMLAIGGSLLYYLSNRSGQMITVSSNAGQTLVVWLPDSSEATLAERSELRYPAKFSRERRKVEMSGKVFFKVRRNTAQPFTVQTPSVSVAVLGTAFQVEASEEQAQVLVARGKVAVISPDSLSCDTLTAGMATLWSALQPEFMTREDFNFNLFAWKTKTLRFQNTPLPEVIHTLNEYYRVRIILPESYKGLRLTAKFKDIPLSKALEIINQTLDIHLTVSGQ